MQYNYDSNYGKEKKKEKNINIINKSDDDIILKFYFCTNCSKHLRSYLNFHANIYLLN